MSEDSFERQTVSMGTVIKWIVIAVSVTFTTAGALYKITELEKDTVQIESRVHNLEENVLWRKR